MSTKTKINSEQSAKKVWQEIGYGDPAGLVVIKHIKEQSTDIARGHKSFGVDAGGAGDQGIMVGYATDETPEMMPQEWLHARNMCMKLRDLRLDRTLPWLKADCKSQVTLNADGSVKSVIIATHHDKEVSLEE